MRRLRLKQYDSQQNGNIDAHHFSHSSPCEFFFNLLTPGIMLWDKFMWRHVLMIYRGSLYYTRCTFDGLCNHRACAFIVIRHECKVRRSAYSVIIVILIVPRPRKKRHRKRHSISVTLFSLITFDSTRAMSLSISGENPKCTSNRIDRYIPFFSL